MMTGSYSNNLHIYNRDTLAETVLSADKSIFKSKKLGSAKNKLGLSRGPGRAGMSNMDDIDFNKKILHSSWHPGENTIAVAATNNLFIFT